MKTLDKLVAVGDKVQHVTTKDVGTVAVITSPKDEGLLIGVLFDGGSSDPTYYTKHYFNRYFVRLAQSDATILGDATDRLVPIHPGYRDLLDVLISSYEQAATGKGKQRHAKDGQAFKDQPIFTITNTLGIGFPMGQAMKKISEAHGMYEGGSLTSMPTSAIMELRGAIVYCAASILYIMQQEGMQQEDKQ